jgi:putative sterol carrier protein
MMKMSDVMEKALAAVQAKMPSGFSAGSAKFVLSGAGAIVADGTGVRISDEETDVTMTATPEVFQAILDGEMNSTGAFMTGKLAVDGNMGLAMQLAAVLA